MEEIDIIEQFLDDELDDLYEIYHTGYINKVVMAIKGVINRLEQDERVIEEMGEYISDFDIDETICKKKTDDCYMDVYIVNGCKECIIDHFRKKCE